MSPEHRYARSPSWPTTSTLAGRRAGLGVSRPSDHPAPCWGRWHKPVLTGLAVLLVSAIPGLTLTTVLVNGEKARKEEQRKLAVANAAQAQENFRLAYEAADGMLTEVGDVELGDVPQMEPVRKRLLDKARRSYQKFLVQKSNDPAVRWGAGRASSRLGNVLEMMGEYADAEGVLIVRRSISSSP